MKCREVIKFIEDWAPVEIAWERDNVGLQVGNTERKLKNIMLSLDLTQQVIDQAIKENCNLIITHHPVLFNRINKIDTTGNRISRLIESAIKNNINLYSAHTNLDFTKDGVSYQLAKKLKLKNIRFLRHLSENQVKLVVFVPESHIEIVANAIHNSGGGIIGEYSNCSYRTKGSGTFRGSVSSNPATGSKGKTETFEEIKLEVLVDTWKLNHVIYRMKEVHPYEEVAYDIIVLKNDNVNYGLGAIGELNNEMKPKDFLNHISDSLKIRSFRFTNGKNKKINKVAVCGGSGSELLNEAITKGADAFITADLKYHTFQDAEGKILLADAGHNETELPVLDEIKRKLDGFLNGQNSVTIFKFKGSTNPVFFYNK